MTDGCLMFNEEGDDEFDAGVELCDDAVEVNGE